MFYSSNIPCSSMRCLICYAMKQNRIKFFCYRIAKKHKCVRDYKLSCQPLMLNAYLNVHKLKCNYQDFDLSNSGLQDAVKCEALPMYSSQQPKRVEKGDANPNEGYRKKMFSETAWDTE